MANGFPDNNAKFRIINPASGLCLYNQDGYHVDLRAKKGEDVEVWYFNRVRNRIVNSVPAGLKGECALAIEYGDDGGSPTEDRALYDEATSEHIEEESIELTGAGSDNAGNWEFVDGYFKETSMGESGYLTHINFEGLRDYVIVTSKRPSLLADQKWQIEKV